MIKFDIDNLRIETVHLKACTTALGGSVRVIDDHLTATTGKEVYKKIDVPMAIVRAFQQIHKQSRYLKPVVTALVYYGDHVVAMERHPLGVLGKEEEEGLFGMREWTPHCKLNIDRFIMPLIDKHEWYIDGKYIYNFDRPIEQMVDEGERLTADGKFRAVEVSAIQLSNLDDRTKIEPAIRTCLAFKASNGKFAVTPPIWKNLGNVGSKNIRTEEEEGKEKTYQFDAIDQQLSVNLSFILKAGEQVGTLFGHEAIEPLQLPELMIRLKTVNLPNVPNAVKQTFDAGIRFTHAMAWLMGMTARSDSIEGYMILRSLLKYLTTKGIYRAELFAAKHVFKRGHDLESIPYIGIEDAKLNASTLSIDELIKQIRQKSATRRVGSQETTIGTLYGAN